MATQPGKPADGLGHRSVSTAALRLVLIGLLGAVLWATTLAATDRLVVTVLAAAMGVGVLAQIDVPPSGSRLPAAAQGLLVGGAVGVTAATVALAGLQAWGLLAALLALPTLFPAVVPRRWRRAAGLRWSDLVSEQARS